MKKFVNDPKQFVPEMLEGIALANPDTLKYVPEYNLIMRADAPRDDKVSIVQGSGSGPRAGARDGRRQGHARRRLSRRRVRRAADGLRATRPPSCSPRPRACCCWSTTTPATGWPSTWRRRWPRPRASRSRRCSSTTTSRCKDSTYTVGRRGVAGNFFVIKAVGAAAERGRRPRRGGPDRREGQRRHPHHGHRADRLHAAGQGLAAVRARRRRDRDGRRHPRRARPASARSSSRADDIVDELLEAVVSDLPYESGDRVALMINGLGGTPISELYILYGRAHQQLADRGHHRRPQLRRRVLHVAGHGRRLAHPGQARRRDRASCSPRRRRSPSGSSERGASRDRSATGVAPGDAGGGRPGR